MNPNPPAQEAPDPRITARWAVDPLGIGTPFNIETEDDKLSVCIVQDENTGGDKTRRNKTRTELAARIVAEHNNTSALVAALDSLLRSKDAGERILSSQWACARRALADVKKATTQAEQL